jgi:hypothetical protein
MRAVPEFHPHDFPRTGFLPLRRLRPSRDRYSTHPVGYLTHPVRPVARIAQALASAAFCTATIGV